jgi:hypothetical protein
MSSVYLFAPPIVLGSEPDLFPTNKTEILLECIEFKLFDLELFKLQLSKK